MKKSGSKLRNLVLAGTVALGLAGGLKGQEQMIDVFSPVNENGIGWNDMNNKLERDSLWGEFLDEDWVSEVPTSLEPWDCSEYTRQLITNNYDWGENINLYDGYKGDPINDSLKIHNGTLRDMGNGGFPVQGVLIPEGSGHEMNAILTGDSLDGEITLWENWNFTEPQYDAINVQPGEYFMPSNCEVIVRYTFVNQNDGYLDGVPILTFQITDGKASRGEINPYLDIPIYKTRLESTDKTFEEAEILSPKQDTTFKDNDAVFEYRVKDKNLDLENSYYEFNGDRTYLTDTVGSIPLNSKVGLNDLELFAIDKVGHSKRENLQFNYDTTTTSITDVKELSKGKNSFYPNPVSTMGTIEYTPTGKDFSVDIYNVSGQKLETILDNDNDGKLQSNYSSYPKGVYFYKASNGNSGKIIKK